MNASQIWTVVDQGVTVGAAPDGRLEGPTAQSHSEELTASLWERKRDGRALVLIFLAVWLPYLLTATYWASQINDTRAAAQSAWTLANEGSLALPEAWRGEADWEVTGRDGRTYTNRFPGPILWGTPFYLVASGTAPQEAVAHPLLLDYAPAGVAGATAAALAVAASFPVLRRLAERRLAVLASLALGLTTSVWSVSADALWPHGLTHLGLMLGLLAASSERFGWAGLAFGSTILSRPHLAVVPAVVGLWSGWRARSWRPVVRTGATSILGLLAVVLYSRSLFGTWLPIAGYNTYAVEGLTGTPIREFLTRVALTFVDPARGVLIYTPLLLVLLPFVRYGWRFAPHWVRTAAVAGVAYMVVQLRANTFHGGAQFFGSRLTIETLVLLTPLLLCTWRAYVEDRQLLRRLGITLALAGVVLHSLGATVWARPYFDRIGVWEETFEELCEDEELTGCPGRIDRTWQLGG